MQIKTTDLDHLKGNALAYGSDGSLWTLAPDQVTATGSLVLTGKAPDLVAIKPEDLRTEPPGALAFTFGSRNPGAIDLTVRAKGKGNGMKGRVVVSVGKEAVAAVTIGEHASHLGDQAVDLIARVSNGKDCRKVVAIQQILQSQMTSIIDQQTGPYGQTKRLACGTVVDQAGTALFDHVDYSGRTYHKPIKPGAGVGKMSWDKIAYDPHTTDLAITQIKSLLTDGTAVRVGAVYEPSWSMLAANGALQAERHGGHSILIVGYAGDRFLYLDPFRGLSRTKYLGGLEFNRGRACEYLGVLEISKTHGPHLTTKVAGSSLDPTAGYLSVISGPLRQ